MRARHDDSDLLIGERLEAVDPHPREERRVDLEVGVLGGRADEHHGAVFDVGQQRVLLGLVEAMDLVDEEEGPAAVEDEPLAGLADESPNLGHSAHDRRDSHQPRPDRVREDASQRRLAAARRTPQQQRAQVAAFRDPSERSARADQPLLADDLVEGPGPHPGGQRLRSRRGSESLLLLGVPGGPLDPACGHGPMLQARCPEHIGRIDVRPR